MFPRQPYFESMFYKFEFLFCIFLAVTLFLRYFYRFLSVPTIYESFLNFFDECFLTFKTLWKPHKMQDGGAISKMKASSLPHYDIVFCRWPQTKYMFWPAILLFSLSQLNALRITKWVPQSHPQPNKTLSE